jgi:hypothetical protein
MIVGRVGGDDPAAQLERSAGHSTSPAGERGGLELEEAARTRCVELHARELSDCARPVRLVALGPVQQVELVGAVADRVADRHAEQHHADAVARVERIEARLIEQELSLAQEPVERCDRLLVEVQHPEPEPAGFQRARGHVLVERAQRSGGERAGLATRLPAPVMQREQGGQRASPRVVGADELEARGVLALQARELAAEAVAMLCAERREVTVEGVTGERRVRAQLGRSSPRVPAALLEPIDEQRSGPADTHAHQRQRATRRAELVGEHVHDGLFFAAPHDQVEVVGARDARAQKLQRAHRRHALQRGPAQHEGRDRDQLAAAPYEHDAQLAVVGEVLPPAERPLPGQEQAVRVALREQGVPGGRESQELPAVLDRLDRQVARSTYRAGRHDCTLSAALTARCGAGLRMGAESAARTRRSQGAATIFAK